MLPSITNPILPFRLLTQSYYFVCTQILGIISKVCIFTSVDRGLKYPHALGPTKNKTCCKATGKAFGDPNGSSHFPPPLPSKAGGGGGGEGNLFNVNQLITSWCLHVSTLCCKLKNITDIIIQKW